MLDFQSTNQSAIARLRELLPELLPGGHIHGNEYRCGDLAGNPGHSFSMNLESGAWADFATEDKGGDPVSLVAAVLGISQTEAARHLIELMGTANTTTKKIQPVDNWEPTPTDKPHKTIYHPSRGKPNATWEYRDQDKKIIGYDCRFDTPGQKKQVLPLTHCKNTSTGKTEYRWKSPNTPRPLYGLDRLAKHKDAPVLFCEGCKATDAVQRLLPLVVALTWQGGSSAVDKADFFPIAGRTVAIWPDNDGPGRKAADAVARAALEAGATEVYIIELPPDKDEGWDLADAELEGWTPKQVNEWIKEHRKKIEPAIFPASSEHDDTDVTNVQANTGKGLSCNGTEKPDVTNVTVLDHERPCYKVFDKKVKMGTVLMRPGVWSFGIKVEKNGDKELVQHWVCSPLHIEAVTFDGQENNFGRLLRIMNTLGRWRNWAMPMELLCGDGSVLRAELLAMGLEYDPKAKNDLANYIQSQHPERRIHCALQVGWNGDSYVLPNKGVEKYL